MELAAIRVRNTIILSFDGDRLDNAVGSQLLARITSCMGEGASDVVIDFAINTSIDFAGARAIARASVIVGPGRLHLAGLDSRARSLLRAVRVAERVHIVEWWTDAVEDVAQAA